MHTKKRSNSLKLNESMLHALNENLYSIRTVIKVRNS
jgi:hypothetical protein